MFMGLKEVELNMVGNHFTDTIRSEFGYLTVHGSRY